MIYDIAGHKASFEQLGIQDYKLRFTQTGHPALPVQPSFPADFRSVHPKSWENPELLIISQAKEQYTAYMTFVSGSCKSGDSFVVPDCQQQDGSSRNYTPRATDNDPKMFFPKKVGEIVSNILTQERLNSSLFCKWWANTKISNDFWIETPEAFFRIHVVPRKGVFDPRLWRTPWHEQRDFLLSELGSVRSTWAVLCSNHKAVPSVHDVWRDPGVNLDPVNALWIGRSVFPRKAPAPSSPPESPPDGQQGVRTYGA